MSSNDLDYGTGGRQLLKNGEEISAVFLTNGMTSEEARPPYKPFDFDNALKRFEEQALCRQGGNK